MPNFDDLFNRMNDPEFLEKLADSPVDPNAVMKYSLNPGTGQEGLQMTQGPELGLQGPQPTQSPGVASLNPVTGGEVVPGVSPEMMFALGQAGQGLTRQPQQQPLEQPSIFRIGANPVSLPNINAGPAERAPRPGLGELLASFGRK